MLYIREDIPSELLSIENQPIWRLLCRDRFEEKEMVALWYI